MTRLLTLTLFLTTVICNGQSFKSRLDSIVDKYDSLGQFNGVIIVAYDSDKIVTYEYGYKDPKTKKETISVNDRFYLASLAKQLTGLTILQLIDKGLIKPDDPIGHYFPELKPALQKVTVRQLANHTNAIHDFHTLTSDNNGINNEKILDLLSLLDTTAFEPGTNWGYSNSGYILLALLVERITMTSFPEYCMQNILYPLGMRSINFVPAKDTVLFGYSSELEQLTATIEYSGPSGLYATGIDIISYYKAVTNNTGKWKKYFALASDWSDDSNEPNWTYGFGWYFSQDDFGEFRAHSGMDFGFYNYIRWYEDTDTMICLLSNKRDDFIKPLREEVGELIKRELKK